MRSLFAVAMAAVLLTGCGSVPIQRTYVLGDAPPSTVGIRSETGLVVIELKTVSVPSYLDSTDILRRTGPNEVTPSPTGRWGERLSHGITDALAASLSNRLPSLVITTTPVSEPARRIIVDIEAVDIGADGRCLVAARWRVSSGAARQGAGESRRGTFGETAASIDDQAVASALTRAIDQLAARIAATITND